MPPSDSSTVSKERILARCPPCDTFVKAECISVHRNCQRVEEKWTCPCGNILYDWKFDPDSPVSSVCNGTIQRAISQLGLF